MNYFIKKGIKKGLFGADKYWETMEQNLNTQKYVKSLNQQIIGKKLFQIVKNQISKIRLYLPY